MKMTDTTYVTLVRNEGNTVEVSPVKKKKISEKTPPGKPSSSPKKTKTIKGIDSMTVEELRIALKKRKIKGLSGLKKGQLAEKLKKEVKTQRTIGGGIVKKKKTLVLKEEAEVREEEVERGGVGGGQEEEVGGGQEEEVAQEVKEEVQGEDLRHGGSGRGWRVDDEGRKQGEDEAKLSHHEATNVTGGGVIDHGIEPAKRGRSKRPRITTEVMKAETNPENSQTNSMEGGA